MRPFIVQSSTPLEIVNDILAVRPHYPRDWSAPFVDVVRRVSGLKYMAGRVFCSVLFLCYA